MHPTEMAPSILPAVCSGAAALRAHAAWTSIVGAGSRPALRNQRDDEMQLLAVVLWVYSWAL